MEVVMDKRKLLLEVGGEKAIVKLLSTQVTILYNPLSIQSLTSPIYCGCFTKYRRQI